MKFLDSVGTWIENPRYVEFNNWFYKQSHENVISLMVTNNRTVWGWLKQYAFETDRILLEVVGIKPFNRNAFRGEIIFPIGDDKRTCTINMLFDTMDEAMDYLIGEYFNRKGNKPLEG